MGVLALPGSPENRSGIQGGNEAYRRDHISKSIMTPHQQINNLYARWKNLTPEQQRRATASIFGGLQTTATITDPVKANDIAYVLREAIERAEN